MGKGLKVVVIVLFALFFCSPVNALEVTPNSVVSFTDLVGDKDGFGLNVLEGQVVIFDMNYGLAAGQITDGWTNRGILPHFSWEHDFIIGEEFTITDAYLEIFTGGQGFYGLSRLLLDGEEIGYLTDGESGGQNYARLDTFDLSSNLNLLEDGHVLIRVETQYAKGGYTVSNQPADNWILDYSQLTIHGVSCTAPTPVPEPSSILLMGIGIIGLAGIGRKKIHKISG